MSEPNVNYETSSFDAERLKLENEHLRQRLKEAEQHIRTLEDFNQYLKKRDR